MEDKIRCPHCNSTQITSQKEGLHIGRAILVGIFTLGIGFFPALLIGRNKIKMTCLSCGNKFKPKQGSKNIK